MCGPAQLGAELRWRLQDWNALPPSPREKASLALEISETEWDIAYFQAIVNGLRKQLESLRLSRKVTTP
jgi:hypothetical protein